ncbi:MAG: JAB domain-containing protein [Janthinobacterium lividum]
MVKEALRHNAAAVILSHNHPSESLEPSLAGGALAQQLRNALALLGIEVLGAGDRCRKRHGVDG